MLLTPHVLSGMLFGSMFPGPLLVPFVSFFSYILLELIPHWDLEDSKKKTALLIRYIDVIASIILYVTLILLKQFNLSLALGGIVSATIYIFFFLVHSLQDENHTFKKIHVVKSKLKNHDRSLWGILIQLAICVICVTVILGLVDFPTWERFQRNFMII